MSGITDPSEEYFKDGTWGWDGTQWRKLPIVWGYSDQYVYDLDVGSCSDVNTYLGSTTVPSGEVWVITNVIGVNLTSAMTRIKLGFYDGFGLRTAAQIEEPVVGEACTLINQMVLHAGDSVLVFFQGCTVGDHLYICTMGYKMKVTE